MYVRKNQNVMDPICESVTWKLFFYELLDAGKDVAVDVIDEVERGQQHEGERRSGDGGVPRRLIRFRCRSHCGEG